MSDGPLAETNDNVPAERGPDHFSIRKRRLVLLMFVYAAFLGVMYTFVPGEDDREMDLLLGLPLLVLVVSWCFADAGQRGFRMGRLMKVLLALAFLLAFPLYAFRTRGIRGLILLLWATLLAVALCVTVEVAAMTTLLAGETLGYWEVER